MSVGSKIWLSSFAVLITTTNIETIKEFVESPYKPLSLLGCRITIEGQSIGDRFTQNLKKKGYMVYTQKEGLNLLGLQGSPSCARRMLAERAQVSTLGEGGGH